MEGRELDELLAIGEALLVEKDIDRLLDMILNKTRKLLCADAGSIYVIEHNEAKIEPHRNDEAPKSQLSRGPMLRFKLSRDDRGAATVEMAFALPVLVIMLYAFVQLAEVYRAVAGMQQALGEGSRYATLCLTQSASGCAPGSAGVPPASPVI